MLSRDTVIRVENLTKFYRLNGSSARYQTLRESISRAFKNSLRHSAKQNGKVITGDNEVWALKDVSFDVKRGEVIGVIGRNGAGKSTLLKILSRITEPTSGCADIRGRVGSLLEVGAGFHPELTGRENIYLNSAILGMKRVEIDKKLDEIVSFAELEKFMDTPVKRYSSGMYMRLAFSVAAHLETEVLLVDEVLAVGDASFQKKCLGKMEDVAKGGRTVLFVSHNMGAVRGLCERAVLLEGGVVVADGDVYQVVESYLSALSEVGFRHESKKHGLIIEDVAVKNSDGERTNCFSPGDDLNIEISFDAPKPIQQPYILLVVRSIHGTCFTANMLIDGGRPNVIEGKGRLCCSFKSIPLLPQEYTIQMAIRTKDGKDVIVHSQEVAAFSVVADLEALGFKGEFVHGLVQKTFPVMIPYEWTLPDGSVTSICLAGESPVASNQLVGAL
ncbi:MAG: ABC transporter ATP-binding protein [Pyrinomonadaceae bacterium]|nr:ABC transporter ATP-binding protein [Pyrinomonadaceae bacterium]